jgi:molecular chaperone GrpE
MPTSPASDEPLSPAGEPPDAATGTPGEVDESAALREELERTQERYRRALADLDNYRKRAVREADRRVAEATRGLLGEWLEAVDSVERALRLEPGDPGLTAVLDQMEAILARHGVVRIEAAGTRFDPVRHEAIAVQPADVTEPTVLEVARSGFVLDDGGILRPAQVVVSRHEEDGS